MKNLLRAGVLAMLGAFASNEVGHAQGVSEPGPYYALPSWDQQLPASTRWITLTNWSSAAVLDRETGLVSGSRTPAPTVPTFGRMRWSHVRA
jgi:hypothetical protein